jgi:hypothetical protein
MVDKIIIGFIIMDFIMAFILAILCFNLDFLTWCARINNPKWAEQYDEEFKKYGTEYAKVKHEILGKDI